MKLRPPSLRDAMRRFARGERGSVTAEMVLWIPVFAYLLCIIADTALVYGKQARALRVLQDANRNFAVGRFADEATTRTYIQTTVRTFAPDATASVVVVDGIIQSQVIMPVNGLTATRLVPLLRNFNVTVSMQQMREV